MNENYTWKLRIWNSTYRCLDLNRDEQRIVEAKQAKYLREVMHYRSHQQEY